MVGQIFETNEFHMNLLSRQSRSSISILPEELIFKILAFLPAHLLHDVVRFVCRAWYAIVQDPQFVAAQWSLSPNTLLVHTYQVTLAGHFSCYNPLDVTECDLKPTDFKFRTRFGVRFLSSCNGLILLRFRRRYYVANPITRRILRLPECPTYMDRYMEFATLAFDASSNVYKVVMVFTFLLSTLHEYAILTVGVDKEWRHPQIEKPESYFSTISRISVPGFIYYDSTTCIYGLDLESETIKSITIPDVCHSWKRYMRPKGDSISLWYHNPEFSMEVWLLRDYKTEEWVKILYIEGGPLRFWLHDKLGTITTSSFFLAAESWLGNDEKILFNIGFVLGSTRSSGRYILYDLNTHSCTEVNIKSKGSTIFLPFISTLAWV